MRRSSTSPSASSSRSDGRAAGSPAVSVGKRSEEIVTAGPPRLASFCTGRPDRRLTRVVQLGGRSRRVNRRVSHRAGASVAEASRSGACASSCSVASSVREAIFELREDVAEMEVDCPRAEEELRRDLSVGQALRDEARDLELLRGQPRLRIRPTRPRILAASAQLRTGTLRPLSRLERDERLECRSQVLACIDASTVATEELAVGEFGPCALERSRRGVVLAQCLVRRAPPAGRDRRRSQPCSVRRVLVPTRRRPPPRTRRAPRATSVRARADPPRLRPRLGRAMRARPQPDVRSARAVPAPPLPGRLRARSSPSTQRDASSTRLIGRAAVIERARSTEGAAAVLRSLPGSDQCEPDERVCLEFALTRILGQLQRFLRCRVGLRPAPCERLGERKSRAGDCQTSDRPDRPGPVDDPRVESQCGRVVADVEGSASGRQHQVDVVELVRGDRRARRGSRRCPTGGRPRGDARTRRAGR